MDPCGFSTFLANLRYREDRDAQNIGERNKWTTINIPLCTIICHYMPLLYIPLYTIQVYNLDSILVKSCEIPLNPIKSTLPIAIKWCTILLLVDVLSHRWPITFLIPIAISFSIHKKKWGFLDTFWLTKRPMSLKTALKKMKMPWTPPFRWPRHYFAQRPSASSTTWGTAL